jgi:predicted RNA-binding Zn-ribbon protein involved in translation (DUF1610 family)
VNVTKPITTVGELVNFINDFVIMLELESFANPCDPTPQQLEAVDTFYNLYNAKLIPTIYPDAHKSKSSGFFASAEMELSTEAKEILSQMQKVIAEANFMAVAGISLVEIELVQGGHKSPKGYHKHKCPKCGNVWEHSNSFWDFTKTHNCFICGTEQLYHYEGPEKPSNR